MSNNPSFDELSFINMVEYYENELQKIIEGASTEEVFDPRQRKKLRKHGILDYSYEHWFVTEKARKILEK